MAKVTLKARIPTASVISSLDKVLANVEYEDVRRRQAERRSAPGGDHAPLLGIGVVIGIEPGGRNAARDMAIFPQSKQMPGAGGVEGATVKIEKNGSVVFRLGSPSCGQSHETTAAQIIADVLGIPPARITMAAAFDSALSPWGVSSSNSGNNFHLYDVGAVHGAATRLRDKVLSLAANLLKADTRHLDIEGGVVSTRLPRDESQDAAGSSTNSPRSWMT